MKTETETTFTPGPYHVEKHNGRYEIWPKDKGQTHTAVATVQREADAKFLAAMPQAIWTLQAVADYFEAIDAMQPNKDHGITGTEVRQSVRAILSKATGACPTCHANHPPGCCAQDGHGG